ncbi:hypothetical protein BT93_B2644 [Corymbia citriodora subsp. variegata]|nr:hypothetical protein BT93_B2644 [Corymbia citriodora subsp. variegata]
MKFENTVVGHGRQDAVMRFAVAAAAENFQKRLYARLVKYLVTLLFFFIIADFMWIVFFRNSPLSLPASTHLILILEVFHPNFHNSWNRDPTCPTHGQLHSKEL